MTCLQIAGVAGTLIQLFGVALTLVGAVLAWNRISHWIDGVAAQLKLARSRVVLSADVAIKVTPTIEGHGELAASARAADPDNRLLNIEKRLDKLPGQIDKKIQSVEAAMDAKLAALDDETGEPPDISDIYWALRGLVIQVLGYFVSLGVQLSG